MSPKSLLRTAAVTLVAVAGAAPAYAAPTAVERPADISVSGMSLPGADVMLNFARKAGG